MHHSGDEGGTPIHTSDNTTVKTFDVNVMKSGNMTLLRQLLSGFCDNIVLEGYDMSGRSSINMLVCYLDSVLTAVYCYGVTIGNPSE